MLVYQLTLLYKIADEAGADVNTGDIGPAHDMRDDDIVEMIVDIANGGRPSPNIDGEHLTERQRQRLLDCYHAAVKRTAPRT